ERSAAALLRQPPPLPRRPRPDGRIEQGDATAGGAGLLSQAFRYVLASHGSSGPFGYGDDLADQIVSAISLGSISVGERLPAEVELAAEFNVAVATLRKSLALLRDHGIVETRRGRGGGTFIVKVPFP